MSDDRLLAPGPVQVPESARLAMARSLMHHRTPAFEQILEQVRQDLAWVFQTDQPVLVLTSSGTGAFEAAMINFTCKEDTIIAIGGGKFGERWGQVGRAYGMNVVDCPVEWGEAVDPSQLRELLEAHPECAMVTVSLSETSTGVLHPLEAIAEVVQEHGRALLAVDGITAVGVHPVPMDELGVDVLVSGSQKAFSVPPGLAFVAAGDRAWERAEGSDHPRYYFDLVRERARQVEQGRTSFTPAISLVVALADVLAKMRQEGLDAIWARHARLAHATRAGLQAMGLELLAARPSNSVTAALVPEGIDAPEVCRRMREVHGVIIAGGQKHLKPRLVRLGHLGRVDRLDVLAGLGALEWALADCGHTLEPGAAVAAAQRTWAGAATQRRAH